MKKLRFFNIFFLKPGLTKTFCLIKSFLNSLDGAAGFMPQIFSAGYSANPRWHCKTEQRFSTSFLMPNNILKFQRIVTRFPTSFRYFDSVPEARYRKIAILLILVGECVSMQGVANLLSPGSLASSRRSQKATDCEYMNKYTHLRAA